MFLFQGGGQGVFIPKIQTFTQKTFIKSLVGGMGAEAKDLSSRRSDI